MNVKSKVWLEKNDKLVFGVGRAGILRAVAETGSLNKAAGELNMSYRHAWSCIKAAEERLGRPLLVRSKGGRKGGGATLTEYAQDLVCKFEILDREVGAFADRCFRDLFRKRRPTQLPVTVNRSRRGEKGK